MPLHEARVMSSLAGAGEATGVCIWMLRQHDSTAFEIVSNWVHHTFFVSPEKLAQYSIMASHAASMRSTVRMPLVGRLSERHAYA